uniref:Uncharacterized protein n=1 Tax=Catharus ustulatus TaxID=91951 RepID=A0A8C3Y1D3_CATUS
MQEEASSARVCLNNYVLSEKLLRSTSFSQDVSGQFQGNVHSPSSLQQMEAGEEDMRHRASNTPAPPSVPAASNTRQSGGTICSPHIQSLPSKSLFPLQTMGASNLGVSKVEWQGFDRENI